jgi:hypothetical protein
VSPVNRRILMCLLVALGVSAADETRAQPRGLVDVNTDAMVRFTGPRWSQIRPDRDFNGGCVIGFLAFQFSPTGYFVFNNRIRGSWRLDELGNLKLRTKDGVTFTLIVEGDLLRPTRNLPFMKRTFQYQRCPA